MVNIRTGTSSPGLTVQQFFLSCLFSRLLSLFLCFFWLFFSGFLNFPSFRQISNDIYFSLQLVRNRKPHLHWNKKEQSPASRAIMALTVVLMASAFLQSGNGDFICQLTMFFFLFQCFFWDICCSPSWSPFPLFADLPHFSLSICPC